MITARPTLPTTLASQISPQLEPLFLKKLKEAQEVAQQYDALAPNIELLDKMEADYDKSSISSERVWAEKEIVNINFRKITFSIVSLVLLALGVTGIALIAISAANPAAIAIMAIGMVLSSMGSFFGTASAIFTYVVYQSEFKPQKALLKQALEENKSLRDIKNGLLEQLEELRRKLIQAQENFQGQETKVLSDDAIISEIQKLAELRAFEDDTRKAEREELETFLQSTDGMYIRMLIETYNLNLQQNKAE